MMEKIKHYYNTRFSSSVIEEAHNRFLSKLDSDENIGKFAELHIEMENESWSYDTLEEFLTEYTKAVTAHFDQIIQGNRLIIGTYAAMTRVVVRFSERHHIEEIFQVFEKNLESSRLVVELDPIKVFIGHGRDLQWKELKDHLHDQHGVDVVAYEVGPRAGLSVKEVLSDMLGKSSFALLILTGEDEHSDGEIHARENVVHELGLFQGKLGFTKAVAILEEGVKEFSNILGVNQIRFSKGKIREVNGDVLATLNREFGNQKMP